MSTAEGATDTPSEEKPPLDDEEKADIDLDGIDLEAIEAEQRTGEASETTSDNAEGETALGDSDALSAFSGDEREASVTWGDTYVDVLGVVLVALVDEFGDEDADLAQEDVVDLANQPPIALNEQANRVLEQMGGARHLPPGQALVVGTATVAVAVLAKETDVLSQALGEAMSSMEVSA